MTLGVIIKSAVFIYCSLKGLEYVFHIPYRYFAIPICMLVSVFSVLIAVNYGDHLEKLKSSLIITFLWVHAIDHSDDNDHYFNKENKKEKLDSKWGEMMSTEKPLVTDKTKKKGFKRTKE